MSNLKPKLFTTLKHYSKEKFVKDVTAGIIVAIIALPLSIALAIASGVSPEKGLHTAIIAGFFISLLGGSRVQIGGPTGAFMIIVYGIIAKHGMEGLIIATIMAGIIMVLMGFLKLGNVIKFIPYPISTGFTSGIAVVIFSSQIKDFFGLNIGQVPSKFIDKWIAYITSANTINYYSLFIGITALLIIIFWPKINGKIPGTLIALIFTTVLVNLLNLDVPTIGSKFGQISSAIPLPQIPNFNIQEVSLLIGPAITIAVLGSIESLLSAVVSDAMIGGKHRSNMELIAQGVANIASGLFGGIPATGAIARTVANIENGGRTPIAGIVHSITLLLIMIIFMPLAKMIPLASLAAVLIIVAYNMSGWREFIALMRAPKSDVLILLVTFFITVLFDLVKAIEIGIVLSSLLFMKRMSDACNIKDITLDASEENDKQYDFDEENILTSMPKGIQLYEINGPFFFGAADKFVEVIKEVSGSKTKGIILRMRNVPFMDATALEAFKRFVKVCGKQKIFILISGINTQPKEVLEKSLLYNQIGQDHFFETVNEAIIYCNSNSNSYIEKSR